MKEGSFAPFFGGLANRKEHFPLNGQLELTYRCGLNCVHCYCKGCEDEEKELTTQEWKGILNEIRKEGCMFLNFTGGEPMIREDFLELYSYAKRKGFVVSILTSGQAFNQKILDFLEKSPPFSIEITLNGITKNTYESITKVKGSFSIVMENIKRIKERKLILILKSNCLKQNKAEIGKIKAFTDKLLGKSDGKYYFRYDSLIYPRLNQDKSPTNLRLSFAQIADIRKQDRDIWKESERCFQKDFPLLDMDKSFLYQCNAWMTNFFINPFGRLKFCNWSEKFSVDLNTTSFKEGFYKVFPQLLRKRFKTNSKCKNCRLRPVCYTCPARAYLETGDEETPVPYFCELAKQTAEQLH